MEDMLIPLAEQVVTLLKRKNKKIAVAESCTGGLLAAYITAIPGASTVFELGMVTYSAATKQNELGVKEATIKSFGTISRQTASEMAENVRLKSGADIGVSITGVAGPDPSEGKKPGTVFISLSSASGSVTIQLNITLKGRNSIRTAVCEAVFDQIIKQLKKD